MNSPDPPYDLNGTEPHPGAACTGFCLLQHQVDGEISDPAQSAYFCFNGAWVQLCFDGSTIFWRETHSPGIPVNDRLSSVLVLVDLNEMAGVVGSALGDVQYWGSRMEVGARLRFASGVELAFTYLTDRDATFIVAIQAS